jgi:tyrosyl-tRNA synthetase
MDPKERISILKSIGEEVLTEQELEHLLQLPYHPRCYDGFEPSGRMHIAQGLMKTISVNKMISANCEIIFWVADIFAMLNNKMNGDLKKIRTIGLYMIEVWKACGMNVEKVKFLWASEEIYRDRASAIAYWSLVTHISTKFSIGRLKRCIQILGRKDGDNNPLSYLMYAAMQCVDIFFLKADICQLGLDQRKVNILAREYADILKSEFSQLITHRAKPIIISHHMLSGLTQAVDSIPVDKDAEVISAMSQLTPELEKFGLNTNEVLNYLETQMRDNLPNERAPECTKMSKSDPDSAIFMEDTPEDVSRKIKKAFCRPGVVDPNPILEYVKYIILPLETKLVIQKPIKWGGECFTYNDYNSLEQDYISGKIHPEELKKAVTPAINRLLQPVRDHFNNDPEAKKLLKEVKKLQKEKKKK